MAYSNYKYNWNILLYYENPWQIIKCKKILIEQDVIMKFTIFILWKDKIDYNNIIMST
jgi:hypothetical protein